MIYTRRVEIQKEVILGIPPKLGEPDDEKKLRAILVKEVAEAREQGVELNYPSDWE